MSKKRQPKRSHRVAHGEGSFFYNETRNIWIGAIYDGYTPSGNRRKRTVSAKDEDTAWKKFLDLRNQIYTGTVKDPKRATMTIAKFSEIWLRDKKKELKPEAYKSEVSKMKSRIVPAVGHMKLEELTGSVLDKIADYGFQKGLSGTSINAAQAELQRMLKDASGNYGYDIHSGVFNKKRTPKDTEESEAIPEADAIKILKHAATMPTGTRWLMGFLQGMRQAECLGLRWGDIDWDKSLVNVEHQLQEWKYADRAAGTLEVPTQRRGYRWTQLQGTYVLSEAKTKAGVRVIPLIDAMAVALKRYQKVAPTSAYDLVWPNTDGSIRNHKQDRNEWYEIQDETKTWKKQPEYDANGKLKGKPTDYYWSVHQIRHTAATLLHKAGLDEITRSKIIGHSSVDTTKIYIHIDVNEAAASLDKVADLLGVETKEIAANTEK